MQDIGLFLIIFIGPLIPILLQDKLFGTYYEEAIEFGNIKWFNSRKGYGFISADQGDEIFVHFRNFTGKETNNIREGQRVKFVTVSSEKACKQTRSLLFESNHSLILAIEEQIASLIDSGNLTESISERADWQDRFREKN